MAGRTALITAIRPLNYNFVIKLSASLANTVGFNVPPSLPNGTIVHPPPEDQYVIDDASRVFSNAGIGNDWGFSRLFLTRKPV
jgi:hypothetical protein